ncbi:uncharacterized [Tachysurus ichikawai]
MTHNDDGLRRPRTRRHDHQGQDDTNPNNTLRPNITSPNHDMLMLIAPKATKHDSQQQDSITRNNDTFSPNNERYNV